MALQALVTKVKVAISWNKNFKKLEHNLKRLNRQKEEVETLKSQHENAGEMVREEVNEWLIEVKSINEEIKILEAGLGWVLSCYIHKFKKFNEIVLERSKVVDRLHQRGTFPDGIVMPRRSRTFPITRRSRVVNDLHQRGTLPDGRVKELREQGTSGAKHTDEEQNKVGFGDMCFVLATCCLFVDICLSLYHEFRH